MEEIDDAYGEIEIADSTTASIDTQSEISNSQKLRDSKKKEIYSQVWYLHISVFALIS
jgi:hypothetical protein